MSMIKLRSLLFESDASEEANRRGLKSAGWGKWKDPSTGETVAKTVKGKLVAIKGAKDVMPGKGKDSGEKPSRKATKGATGIGTGPGDHPGKDPYQNIKSLEQMVDRISSDDTKLTRAQSRKRDELLDDLNAKQTAMMDGVAQQHGHESFSDYLYHSDFTKQLKGMKIPGFKSPGGLEMSGAIYFSSEDE